MAGLEMMSAPSFSLGLGLDLDSDSDSAIDISDLPTDAEEEEEEGEENHQERNEQNQSSNSNKTIQLELEEKSEVEETQQWKQSLDSKRKTQLQVEENYESETLSFNIFPDLNLDKIKENPQTEEKNEALCDQFEEIQEKYENYESFSLEASLVNQDPPCQALRRLRRGPAVKRTDWGNSNACSRDDYCLKQSDCCEQKLQDENLSNDFSTKRNSNPNLNSTNSFKNPNPPCFGYFYNSDSRIRVLVREMLPHFVPLGTESNIGDDINSQSVSENIDYLVSFDTGEPQKGWVNPRERVSHKKDAPKRKHGRKSGRWFTQNGRKVYVTKNGQEFTGQSAYRNYTKESGVGYAMPRKKKTSAPKKRQKL